VLLFLCASLYLVVGSRANAGADTRGLFVLHAAPCTQFLQHVSGDCFFLLVAARTLRCCDLFLAVSALSTEQHTCPTPGTNIARMGYHATCSALPRAGYYGTFMMDVFERMNGKVHVTTVASLGFSRSPPSPLPLSTSAAFPRHFPTFTLEQQIDHKEAFLRHVCSKDIGVPIVLIGHSIGFYMALRAARALEEPQGRNSHALDAFMSAKLVTNTSNTMAHGTTTESSASRTHMSSARRRYVPVLHH
jgi:hypothetical protein